MFCARVSICIYLRWISRGAHWICSIEPRLKMDNIDWKAVGRKLFRRIPWPVPRRRYRSVNAPTYFTTDKEEKSTNSSSPIRLASRRSQNLVINKRILLAIWKFNIFMKSRSASFGRDSESDSLWCSKKQAWVWSRPRTSNLCRNVSFEMQHHETISDYSSRDAQVLVPFAARSTWMSLARVICLLLRISTRIFLCTENRKATGPTEKTSKNNAAEKFEDVRG